ncbi:hypothetical protein FBX98_14411 [Burkholderia sp. SJZ115]|nr:hypothetical protein FBX98_14411 [Burkholderia sp. SJZ115]TWC95342.1 hypothetical protein FB601_14511 [Burkholderia sp. SJZ091]
MIPSCVRGRDQISSARYEACAHRAQLIEQGHCKTTCCDFSWAEHPHHDNVRRGHRYLGKLGEDKRRCKRDNMSNIEPKRFLRFHAEYS